MYNFRHVEYSFYETQCIFAQYIYIDSDIIQEIYNDHMICAMLAVSKCKWKLLYLNPHTWHMVTDE